MKNDIKQYFYNTFNLDIEKVNILNLYEIDDSNISLEEIDRKIKIAREKYNRLNEENTFNFELLEHIIRNKELFKLLSDYYTSSCQNRNLHMSTLSMQSDSILSMDQKTRFWTIFDNNLIMNIFFISIYWPVLLFYSVCKLLTNLLDRIHLLALLAALITFVISNITLPKFLVVPNILELVKMFQEGQWYDYVCNAIGPNLDKGILFLIPSLAVLIVLLAIYLIPAFFIGYIILGCTELSYDNELHLILDDIYDKLENKRSSFEKCYLRRDINFYKVYIKNICLYIICIVFLIFIIMYFS